MCPSTLCTFFFFYILHDTFFTTTCSTTVSKYSVLYMSPSNLYTYVFVSLYVLHDVFFSLLLPAQQRIVSTLVFKHMSIHFMYTFVSLYILHDTFFTTTCTTTGGKYFCFYTYVHTLYVHICLSLCPPSHLLHHYFHNIRM